MFSLPVSVEVFYFGHLFLYISRGDNRLSKADLLVFIVDISKDDGDLCFQSRIIKTQFPVGVGLTGCFGSDSYGKPVVFLKKIGPNVG